MYNYYSKHWTSIFLRDFKDFEKLKSEVHKYKHAEKQMEQIRRKCFKFPIYMIVRISVLMLLVIVCSILNGNILSIRASNCIISILSLLIWGASLKYVLAYRFMKKILERIENHKLSKMKEISLGLVLICQIMPIILSGNMLTFLITFSTHMEDKSKNLRTHYELEIKSLENEKDIKSKEELKTYLKSVHFYDDEDTIYLIDDENNFEYISGANIRVNEYYEECLDKMVPKYGNKMYGYWLDDYTGVLIPINVNGNVERVAVIYNVDNSRGESSYYRIVYVFLWESFIVILTGIALSGRLKKVYKKIIELGSENNLFKDKIVITACDEIGQCAFEVNKMQDVMKGYTDKLLKEERILTEKEKVLAVMNITGSTAHNLKTPVMSISGATEAIDKLAKELDESLDNASVTKNDYKEIAKEIVMWSNKIKKYNEYISYNITNRKSKISNIFETHDSKIEVCVEDLVEELKKMSKDSVDKDNVKLDVVIECENDRIINGNVQLLARIVANLISNAVESYDNLETDIDKKVEVTIKEFREKLYIVIRDYGVGIANEVQEKLFKEMVTTKGKNGSGMDLYLAKSIIRSNFNGNLYFKSKLGAGSTFTIEI